MAYKIIFSSDTQKQLQSLSGQIKSVARERIAALSHDPRPLQSKQLVGYPNHYRIWIVGSYRIIWLVNNEEQWLEIQYIGPKTPDLYVTLGLGRPNINDSGE